MKVYFFSDYNLSLLEKVDNSGYTKLQSHIKEESCVLIVFTIKNERWGIFIKREQDYKRVMKKLEKVRDKEFYVINKKIRGVCEEVLKSKELKYFSSNLT